jgi:hypothetical protein
VLKSFGPDPFPDKPRVLFIGLSQSSHTHSWIDLLDDVQINVRLFALPTGVPPDRWPIRTYVSAHAPSGGEPSSRVRLHSRRTVYRVATTMLAKIVPQPGPVPQAKRWLAEVIREWRPHIIHTFGLDPAGCVERRAVQPSTDFVAESL